MYQDLKERTDREIAQLNRTKQDLELRLRSVLESHQGGIADLIAGEGGLQSSEPMVSTLTAGLPNLTASEVVEALSKWEGMEDTIVLFKEQLEAENGWSHSHIPVQWNSITCIDKTPLGPHDLNFCMERFHCTHVVQWSCLLNKTM